MKARNPFILAYITPFLFAQETEHVLEMGIPLPSVNVQGDDNVIETRVRKDGLMNPFTICFDFDVLHAHGRTEKQTTGKKGGNHGDRPLRGSSLKKEPFALGLRVPKPLGWPSGRYQLSTTA